MVALKAANLVARRGALLVDLSAGWSAAVKVVLDNMVM